MLKYFYKIEKAKESKQESYDYVWCIYIVARTKLYCSSKIYRLGLCQL